MGDIILDALQANRFIPTPHWEPRCDVCRLARTKPEAYEWVTTALLDATLTQEQIAAALAQRFGVAVTQPQLSRHKTRHLDPDLADARESFIGHRVFLEACGDMPPEQMAVVYAQLAMVQLGRLLQQAAGEADSAQAAKLGASIAALSRVLQTGTRLPKELAQLDIEVEATRIRAALARGELGEAVAEHIRQHYPELLPALRAMQSPETGPEGSDATG